MRYTQEDIPPGRDEFWRENAAALLIERNEKIVRLRKRIHQLEKSTCSRRKEIERLQGLVESLASRVAAQSELLSRRAGKDEVLVDLFRWGDFTLASGVKSRFKIDCDALTDADWHCLAHLISERFGPFGAVEGVPRGGLKLAAALVPLALPGWPTLLIVDDVVTTGASLQWQRQAREATCVAVFGRNPVPGINVLFPLAGIGAC